MALFRICIEPQQEAVKKVVETEELKVPDVAQTVENSDDDNDSEESEAMEVPKKKSRQEKKFL